MKTIRCTANKGKQYDVTFDDSGNVNRVDVIYPNQFSGETVRPVFDARVSNPMSITAACAVRAAQKNLRGPRI